MNFALESLSTAGARGASAEGMVFTVRCKQLLLLLCRSYVIRVLVAYVARLLVPTTPIKVNWTHFATLTKANGGRRCPPTLSRKKLQPRSEKQGQFTLDINVQTVFILGRLHCAYPVVYCSCLLYTSDAADE